MREPAGEAQTIRAELDLDHPAGGFSTAERAWLAGPAAEAVAAAGVEQADTGALRDLMRRLHHDTDDHPEADYSVEVVPVHRPGSDLSEIVLIPASMEAQQARQQAGVVTRLLAFSRNVAGRVPANTWSDGDVCGSGGGTWTGRAGTMLCLDTMVGAAVRGENTSSVFIVLGADETSGTVGAEVRAAARAVAENQRASQLARDFLQAARDDYPDAPAGRRILETVDFLPDPSQVGQVGLTTDLPDLEVTALQRLGTALRIADDFSGGYPDNDPAQVACQPVQVQTRSLINGDEFTFVTTVNVGLSGGADPSVFFGDTAVCTGGPLGSVTVYIDDASTYDRGPLVKALGRALPVDDPAAAVTALEQLPAASADLTPTFPYPAASGSAACAVVRDWLGRGDDGEQADLPVFTHWQAPSFLVKLGDPDLARRALQSPENYPNDVSSPSLDPVEVAARLAANRNAERAARMAADEVALFSERRQGAPARVAPPASPRAGRGKDGWGR